MQVCNLWQRGCIRQGLILTTALYPQFTCMEEGRRTVSRRVVSSVPVMCDTS
jgi:hypothetical protein